jgi:ribulose 1,5-bisphosphate carboxylase large subunit-like protein
MDTVDLTILAENADSKALYKFIADLQRLKDLPTAAIDIVPRSDTAFELKICYPLNVFDRSVGQFLAVLFGEIPFMRAFGRARFEDLTLPLQAYDWFRGPAFGAAAVLDRFGASESPLLVAILKPSLDLELTLEGLERRIAEPLAGGFHAAKDDEMQGDFPNLPLDTRLELASRNRGYIPAVNLDDMRAFHDVLQRSEIGMVLLNPTIIGFPALHELRKSTRVPIFSHLSMQGIYATCFSHRLYAMLHRLFGSDAFITPIGDTHYYRASTEDEAEMVSEFTSELPIAKTLPMLTGGGSMENLATIVTRRELADAPYGIVLGGLISNSEKGPREMARTVVETVADVKGSIRLNSK